MKKHISMMMAAMMAATVLAGCGASGGAAPTAAPTEAATTAAETEAETTAAETEATTEAAQAAGEETEILVAAAGHAKMLNGDYVGDDAVVIDVGINVDENGKLCGDVDYDTILEKAQAATPVPGGVGAVTTAVLAKHLMRAAGLL